MNYLAVKDVRNRLSVLFVKCPISVFVMTVIGNAREFVRVI